jgi:hypothetical protein
LERIGKNEFYSTGKVAKSNSFIEWGGGIGWRAFNQARRQITADINLILVV